ncbi:MAG: hypothetical protein AAFX85_12580, partial [Pseudomonadota bacterium]
MNLLVLANRHGGVRSVRVNANQVLVGVAAFSVILGVVGFVMGAGVGWAMKVRAEQQVDVLEAQVAYQTAALDSLEQTVEDNLDAVVARVPQGDADSRGWARALPNRLDPATVGKYDRFDARRHLL